MCELLGMSANVPTDICFSFTGLTRRAGKTGPHVDGWGITFYDGKGCRSFKDTLPASESTIAKFIQNYPIKSCAVISHIRQANVGSVALENTHPFTRELWGREWTFAHNGQLEGSEGLEFRFFQPVGDTDSERAFCWLLKQLHEQYPQAPDNFRNIFDTLVDSCHRLRGMGVFNILLTDGEYVFAYCSNNLHWITRCAPFGEARLIDEEMRVDFYQETTPNDIVTVIATQPLTDDEAWQKMQEGEARLFRFGQLVEF
ncbi:MAG: class II glutamine amidotransferase [Porticoccaceae bacterium]|nr:class II glutamine amidotransferase [Pseudomonadales bacterium]MCP5171485.1 class II glutamine amidotransferase [Pseudomonadales bacterium]